MSLLTLRKIYNSNDAFIASTSRLVTFALRRFMNLNHFELTFEATIEVDEFVQRVVDNSMAAYQHVRELQAQIEALRATNTTSFSSFNTSTLPSTSSNPPSSTSSLPPTSTILDAHFLTMIAQIVAQTIQNQSPSPTPTTAVHTPGPAIAAAPRLFEKLSNVTLYEGDKDNLRSWLQSLILRMSVNHDRYLFDSAKIAYAESRLTIEKKAHSLMSQYRVNDLCTLTDFVV